MCCSTLRHQPTTCRHSSVTEQTGLGELVFVVAFWSLLAAGAAFGLGWLFRR